MGFIRGPDSKIDRGKEVAIVVGVVANDKAARVASGELASTPLAVRLSDEGDAADEDDDDDEDALDDDEEDAAEAGVRAAPDPAIIMAASETNGFGAKEEVDANDETAPGSSGIRG